MFNMHTSSCPTPSPRHCQPPAIARDVVVECLWPYESLHASFELVVSCYIFQQIGISSFGVFICLICVVLLIWDERNGDPNGTTCTCPPLPQSIVDTDIHNEYILNLHVLMVLQLLLHSFHRRFPIVPDLQTLLVPW